MAVVHPVLFAGGLGAFAVSSCRSGLGWSCVCRPHRILLDIVSDRRGAFSIRLEKFRMAAAGIGRFALDGRRHRELIADTLRLDSYLVSERSCYATPKAHKEIAGHRCIRAACVRLSCERNRYATNPLP